MYAGIQDVVVVLEESSIWRCGPKCKNVQSLFKLKYFEVQWQSIQSIWKELEDSAARCRVTVSGPRPCFGVPGLHVQVRCVRSVLTN